MFSLWMISFLLLMAALVWVAVVVGLPQPFIGLVVLALVIGAVIVAAAATRRPRASGRTQRR